MNTAALFLLRCDGVAMGEIITQAERETVCSKGGLS